MKFTIPLIISCAVSLQAFAQVPPQVPAPSAEALYQNGLAAEKTGKIAAARDFYRSALKANPNHANARYSMGQLKINAPAIAAKGREAKFAGVIIPLFQLDQATLQEATAALSQMIQTQSKGQVVPNFVIEDPKLVLTGQKISLDLKNLPASAVIKYLNSQTATKTRYDEHAVVMVAR